MCMLNATKMKKIVLFLLFFHCFFNSIAQESLDKPKFIYRLEPGLILGGEFANNAATLSFIPYLSYDIKPNFLALGLSPNLTYIRTINGGFSEILYGGSIFGKVFISKSFYAQIENELLSRKFISANNTSKRKAVNHFMLGGGYRRSASFGYTFVSGFYILNYKNYTSPYSRPILIRAGVSIRLNSTLIGM